MSNDVSLDINQKSNPVQTVAPPEEDNNMLRATDKITALYCRLSVEDTKEKGGKDDPSNSIQHQQIMLMEYAKSQHFPNPTFFIDDGYSGVDFSNRPGFQKMLAEIEAGHVEVVITKDLSRLGRNSSLTGLYINYTFPQYGVRYIAINDHFDTIDPNSTDSDMAGIKNWFNEWYSKDTSRKIRAVNKAKGERGERLTTNIPYCSASSSTFFRSLVLWMVTPLTLPVPPESRRSALYCAPFLYAPESLGQTAPHGMIFSLMTRPCSVLVASGVNFAMM